MSDLDQAGSILTAANTGLGF